MIIRGAVETLIIIERIGPIIVPTGAVSCSPIRCADGSIPSGRYGSGGLDHHAPLYRIERGLDALARRPIMDTTYGTVPVRAMAAAMRRTTSSTRRGVCPPLPHRNLGNSCERATPTAHPR